MNDNNRAAAMADADARADEILTAFAAAGPSANLADWTGRYPEHARSLARLAAAQRWNSSVAADRTAGSGGGKIAAADARVLAVGRAALAAARASAAAQIPQTQQTAVAAAAPLTSLLAAARARGLSADALAAHLDLPVACFWKLHRRLFAPDSLPRTLVAQLAQALDRTMDEVESYLRQPPTLAASASYKADEMPAIGMQEDFAASLAQDADLTNTQRARWLASGTE
jgi:hypothetical protein